MALNYAVVAPEWLVARPIAHRGLHDGGRTIVENTATAARAAVSGNFAIECDVQLSSDDEAMVIHDFALDRLAVASGPVSALSARELQALALKATSDHILPLADYLSIIEGRAPLVCEIKSRFDGDLRLARRTAEIAAACKAPMALKSFDPAVMTYLQGHRESLGLQDVPLGMIGMAEYEGAEWAALSAEQKHAAVNFLHLAETRPDFVSYRVDDLPHAVPFLCRLGIGLPVMTWTVRTSDQKQRALLWADQIVFEGDPGYA